SPHSALRRPRPPRREPPHARLLERALDAPRERLDDRTLVGGREVGAPALRVLLPQRSQLVEQGGLQAAEGEVEPRDLLRGRKRERLGVAVLRQLLQRRPARKAEPEHPRALVERLPRG